jgi:hypothetical protein
MVSPRVVCYMKSYIPLIKLISLHDIIIEQSLCIECEFLSTVAIFQLEKTPYIK